MRILPRVNEDVNEEWISDKTRHVVDGLRTQRLDQPYIRQGGRLVPASWSRAFAVIAAKMQGVKQDGAALDPALGRASYLFNATIAGIDQADGIMLIGANPRKEAPVLNARIRKRWRNANLKI